jgi:hypothetical protein
VRTIGIKRTKMKIGMVNLASTSAAMSAPGPKRVRMTPKPAVGTSLLKNLPILQPFKLPKTPFDPQVRG